jgi:hypothetical protein
MVGMPKVLIGTPFKSSDKIVAKKINKRVKELSAQVNLNKSNIFFRDFSDKVKVRALPKSKRPGAIE